MYKVLYYPRTERGGSRGLYWRASASASDSACTCACACQPPFSREHAPAVLILTSAVYASTKMRIVAPRPFSRALQHWCCGCQCSLQPRRGYANIKANKATTAPDLILNRWPSPRGASPAKRSCCDCDVMLKADSLRCMHCKTTRMASWSCQQYHDCNDIIALYDVMKHFLKSSLAYAWFNRVTSL